MLMSGETGTPVNPPGAASPGGFFLAGVPILIIHYVDGPCGSAKTFAAIRHAHRLAQMGKKVLFVQPSIFLINETLKDFANLMPQDVRHRAIHGETSNRVIADVVDHLTHTRLDGEVLFITHSAFMRLPYMHRKQDWHVLVDEIPSADWCGEFTLPNTHALITDCFTIEPDAENLRTTDTFGPSRKIGARWRLWPGTGAVIRCGPSSSRSLPFFCRRIGLPTCSTTNTPI